MPKGVYEVTEDRYAELIESADWFALKPMKKKKVVVKKTDELSQ